MGVLLARLAEVPSPLAKEYGETRPSRARLQLLPAKASPTKALRLRPDPVVTRLVKAAVLPKQPLPVVE